LAALLFVAGFSTVFVLLGATASAPARAVKQTLRSLLLLAERPLFYGYGKFPG
jgi:cytochrome c-type biogenesis protein